MNKRDESAKIIAKLVERLASNGVMSDEVSSHELFDHYPKSDDIQLFIDAVKWLRNEGVIRADQGYSGPLAGETVFSMTLTSRGFWLLEQKLANDLTLGSALTRIREGQTMYTGLGDFIGSALGGFTKSMGS